MYLPNVALFSVFSSEGVKELCRTVGSSIVAKDVFQGTGKLFFLSYCWIFVLFFSLFCGQSKKLTLVVAVAAYGVIYLSERNKDKKVMIQGEELELANQLHIYFALVNPLLIHAGILQTVLTAAFYTISPVAFHMTYFTVRSCVHCHHSKEGFILGYPDGYRHESGPRTGPNSN